VSGSLDVLVDVRSLQKHFPFRRGFRRAGWLHAVDDVSFSIRNGETLGLVGESGCGKSTLARCVVRLLEPTSGALTFAGLEITHLDMRRLRPLRRQMQLVFQDPTASLNPRKAVGKIIEDGLSIHGIGTRADRRRRVFGMLRRVGLSPEHATRLPRDLSGGQRQRIGIARALVLGPKLIVADEPVSGLDVSVQAGILNLFNDLQKEFGMTYLFISHDLAVIRQVSDRVGVMYLGKLVELAPAPSFYSCPKHPYSIALLASIPSASPDKPRDRPKLIEGERPSPIAPPSGCRFHPRCAHASEQCRSQEPPLRELSPDHLVACHHPRNIAAAPLLASATGQSDTLSTP
jgi:oligopeptide/dipeptide ABC transporter ATP-binding protein